MDVDAIVLGSLKKCFELNIYPYCITGVKDVVKPDCRERVGLDLEMAYINAGFILWDLDECRHQNIVGQMISFVRERDGVVHHLDQGTINGVMRGNIFVLLPKYNVLTPMLKQSVTELNKESKWKYFYDKEELNEAKNNPVFVHFVPWYAGRPWFKSCNHPLKNKYKYFRDKTPYKVDSFEDDKRPLKMRLLSKLCYSLPYFIFRELLNLYYWATPRQDR